MAGDRRQGVREGGFSALEAIVAITILAVGLVPLAGLQARTKADLAQIDRSLDRMEWRQEALVLLAGVNPMQESRGSWRLSDGATVSWAAAPVSAVRPALGADGAPSDTNVAIYRIRLERQSDVADVMEIDAIGWAPVVQTTERGARMDDPR
jgi:Tfp pilus assembly protein PilV